jgi:hypothetical protein
LTQNVQEPVRQIHFSKKISHSVSNRICLNFDPEFQAIEKRMGDITFAYDQHLLKSKLAGCIARNINADVWNWLQEKASQVSKNENVQNLMVAFTAMPRKTGRQPMSLSATEINEIRQANPHLVIRHWTIDRLCRVWLLMHLDPSDRDVYVRTIEKLFSTAELSEQVALYSALPLLAYPELWRRRCAEGIRSNIADVLESIMCDNPYPSENLDEPAWNQMVLKAIFTEKPIQRIINLDERANQNLANTLSDYAHERWAAHRSVHPLLWRCVGKFIDERIFPDIIRIAGSEKDVEREAAALACMQSTYPPALELVKKNETLQAIAKSGISWADVEKKLEKNT